MCLVPIAAVDVRNTLALDGRSTQHNIATYIVDWLFEQLRSNRNSIKTIDFPWFSAIGSWEASDRIGFLRNAVRSHQTAKNRFRKCFAAALTATESIVALRNACYSVRFCWKTAQFGSRELKIDNYSAVKGCRAMGRQGKMYWDSIEHITVPWSHGSR
jgi:hypothetical protein